MLHGRPVHIEAAAGLDETAFGTDAVRIKEAIEQVDGPGGVVVLMDLGSAVLSAELALDLLSDPSARDRVTLSAAPIVEGLIVAAVAAAGGASRTEVAAEASGALLGKAAHLANPVETGPPSAAQPSMGEITAVFTVTNPHGLHARPAARLVGEVRELDASVLLRNLTTGAGPVPAASLSRVATLGAMRDHQVEVRASGPKAQEAVDNLLALAERRFDEPDDAVTTPELSFGSTPAGPLPASAGVAVGQVRKLTTTPVDLDQVDRQIMTGDADSEWHRIVTAVAEVRREIEHVRVQTLREVGPEEAGIFDAHLTLLADSEILANVKTRIGHGIRAHRAWAECLAEVERQWAELRDPYLRERAADVAALAQQVLRALSGTPDRLPSTEGILVARNLTPADAAGLDGARVLGIVLASGSASSHAAILARARNIPMVVAAGRSVLEIPDGTSIVIDGGSGELHVDPATDVLKEFQRRARESAERRERDLAVAGQPAVSQDGVRFHVVANLGSVADARSALSAGADGAGLVRTEFLFLGRDAAPDLAEQHEKYVAIANAMAGLPVTLRTLDVGGDKPLPYLPVPFEENPFLGLRGIRLSLDRRDLLRQQLDAVCRTARRFPISVMFPMITTIDELLEARRILADAAGPDGLPDHLRVGMMVEVPAAALKIESFLPHLDFVSIGTNDLTQYTLAAERGNAAVASLSDGLDPAVLQLIRRVCQAAHGLADVAVCGETASDELAIPVLLGLGVRELSVSPQAVPGVKATIRALDVELCRAVAERALSLPSAADVRKLVLTSWSETSP
jgi:phosphocarrier protein FPr